MKKLIVSFLVLLFSVLESQAQSLQEQIKTADDYYYSGKYEEAIRVYENALSNKSYPKDSLYVVLLTQLGWAYIDKEQYAKAEPLFTEGKNINEKLFGKNHPEYAYSCSFLSLLYYYQGAFAKAESFGLEAKTVREKALGKDDPTYANSCFNLAELYVDWGFPAKAEPLYLESKNSYEKTQGKEGKDYIKACRNLADLYSDKGAFRKAEPLYIEIKNYNEKTVGKEDPAYARACHNLALTYLDLAQFSKAEALFIESKNVIAKTSGTDHPDYANCCNSLANVYFQQALYHKAEILYNEAKIIYEKKSGKESSDYAIACNNLAGLYREEGLYSKADPLYLEAKKIQEKLVGKNHPDYALACNNLASVYGAEGSYNKAEPLFTEAKMIYEKKYGKDHPAYALSCSNLANLYLDQGLYPQAELLFVESKNIKETLYTKNHPEYANACNSLANLYSDQGLYNKAEPLYTEAKNIREKIFGKEHPLYATSCNNLANLYFNQRLYAKAEPLYLEAKSIQEKTIGKDHPAYAMSCNNLGSVYYRQLLYSKAEPYYLEAKNIQERKFGKDHPDYALSCNNLANLYRQQGQYGKAETYFLEAKNIREKILGKDHPLYANSCNNLATLYSEQGNYAKAGPLYKEAIENKLKQIDEVLPTLSEKERDEFYKSIIFHFKRYYDHVVRARQPALYSDLFNLQLQIKGLIFQSTQKMQRQILNSGNATLVQHYENWKVQRIALNRYLQLPIAERTSKGINTDSLLTVLNELEKTLSKESEAFASSRGKQRPTWQEIQKKLLPGEAAVELIRTDSAYIALIVKPATQGNPEAVLLTNRVALDKRLINYYRTCIAHKIDDEKSYDNFWLPIKEKLGTTTKVYVCADGVYHQLNLLTLKNPVTNAYLLTETNIQLVSNLKDLLTVKQAKLDQQYEQYKIHLIAYPQYDGGTVNTQKELSNPLAPLKSDTSQRFYDRGGKIVMLTGTKVEAGNIAALCTQLNLKPEVKLLEEASESYLKSLRNPGILHIATHGFFLSTEESAENARALNGNDEPSASRDPLLNSGLLLANAQQGMSGLITNGEDGVLTAKEALNLTLDKTELVVMSACETGLGEIRNGEGVYGLQRAFQQAGAKTVIISLWKVSDEATQELMSTFYQNFLSRKMTRREAFREAQTTLMKKYPEPYYWGAFVMMGE